MQTPLGQKQLVDIIADQAEIEHRFDPQDQQQIDRVLHCTYCALPFFGVSFNLVLTIDTIMTVGLI